MAFVPAKCTQCGANITVDDSKDAAICEFCGTAFVTEKVINNYQMNITNNNIFYGASVTVSGPNVDNLYKAARTFRKNCNMSEALKYYNMILPEDPTSWEAFFYCTYCKVAESYKHEIREAAQCIVICLDSVLDMIDEREKTDELKIAALREVGSSCITLADSFHSFILNPEGVNLSITEIPNHVKEVAMTCINIAAISYMVGDKIEQRFPRLVSRLTDVCVNAWKQGVAIHQDCNRHLPNKQQGQQVINEYILKIKRFEPEYDVVISASEGQTGGCYVATAVYGSYDCPQVWTLRRFRDNTLAETWYGRAFIRTYYAISPTLVKWFGRTAWFKNLWKPILDRLVKNLNESGVLNTPYNDMKW